MLITILINTPDSIIIIDSELNNEIQTDSNDDFQNDHDYLESYFKVSAFVDNITEYISGFVARKASKLINCNICKEFFSS